MLRQPVKEKMAIGVANIPVRNVFKHGGKDKKLGYFELPFSAPWKCYA